jgi:protein TilB
LPIITATMGVWITEDLLRKSSEHNECVISTMEEVALHQRNIDRITLLNSACRELRIIYLQNNNISRIENVNRLKELRYLNLAINKIRQVEGLHRCEWLTKLDFTVNRIDARGLLTCERLKDNVHLGELYLYACWSTCPCPFAR